MILGWSIEKAWALHHAVPVSGFLEYKKYRSLDKFVKDLAKIYGDLTLLIDFNITSSIMALTQKIKKIAPSIKLKIRCIRRNSYTSSAVFSCRETKMIKRRSSYDVYGAVFRNVKIIKVTECLSLPDSNK